MKQANIYQLINIQSGFVVKTCKTRTADNRGSAYGAVRFVVKPVY